MICNGCKIGFFESIRKFHNPKKCYKIFKNHGITDLWVKCPECEEKAKLSEDKSHWYCECGHGFERLAHPDYWLETFYSSPTKHCIFMTLYLQTDPPDENSIAQELTISHEITTSWVAFIRDVLQEWCLRHSTQELGGPDVTVEMNEAELENNHFGGRSLEGRWVFSGIEKGKKAGEFFFEIVPDRSPSTLVEVIKRRIRPGTKLLFPSQMAISSLQEEGFNSLKASYDINCLEPRIGIYIQNIPTALPEDDQNHLMSGCLADILFRLHLTDYYDRIHHFLISVNNFDRANKGLQIIEINVGNNINNDVDDNIDASSDNTDTDSDRLDNSSDNNVDSDVNNMDHDNADGIIDNNIDPNFDNMDTDSDRLDHSFDINVESDNDTKTWGASLAFYLSCLTYSIVGSILFQRVLVKYNINPFGSNNNDTSS